MDTNNSFLRRACLTSLAILLVIFSVSCSFEGNPDPAFCAKFEELPLTELTSQDPPTPVFENPGTIKVMHGFGSAKVNAGAFIDLEIQERGFIKVEQSLEIPEYANKATVFLNGWKLSYLGDDDQNVAGLGTLVGKIGLEGRKLTWNAIGILRDNDAHEGNDWTYYYTVIAWNDAALSVLVNHDDADNFCKAGTGGSDNFYFTTNWGVNRRTTTALSSFSSFLQTTDFPPRGNVAILPRGFGFGRNSDNNLLQVAYNLDHSETFVEYGKKYQKAFGDVLAPLLGPVSLANSGFVSWNTYSIFKDNELKRNYMFGEMISALGGNDVAVLQPPFSILPREELGGNACISQDDFHGVKSEDFVIENVPFEYAIPMLTGWELRYQCDDENVKEIGIWIDKWSYVKDPANPHGRLSYTLSSILRDKNDDPGHNRSHKVTILGLKPTDSVIRR